MKNFDHVKLNNELPEITTESIKIKDFMLRLNNKIHQSQLFYQIETKKIVKSMRVREASEQTKS